MCQLHVLTKILESVTHTLKSLNLKYDDYYYYRTTPRSVNFIFSKALLSFKMSYSKGK
eukprot:UN15217